MLEHLNPEHQVNKRIQRYLVHKSTEANIAPEKARLVFRPASGLLTVHLYENNRHIEPLTIQSILEFFGVDYEEGRSRAVTDYLHTLAKEENIKPDDLVVVVCEVKARLGAHLYEGPMYRKKIPTLTLITHFYFST